MVDFTIAGFLVVGKTEETLPNFYWLELVNNYASIRNIFGLDVLVSELVCYYEHGVASLGSSV